MIGNDPYGRATSSRLCALRRCCQSGVRCPGRRRGIRRARRRSRGSASRRAPSGRPPARRGPRAPPARRAAPTGRRRVCVGKVQRDPVVRPERLHLERERVAQLRLERHRPRRVDAAAERGQDADPPVADLVAEPLDDDGPVGGEGALSLLVAQEGEEVLRRELIEVVVLAEPRRRARRPTAPTSVRDGCTDLPPELVGPPHALALPERHGTRDAGRGRDEHPVARDLLDPPGGGAEHERLAFPRLVDHLLVELPDAAAVADLEDAEEAAVGDRAGVRHREPARARAAADRRRRCGPRRSADAARRTRRRDSAPRACRARSRAARARDRRTDTRRATSACSSSTAISSSAQIATTCWARTSRGFRGIAVSSIAPSRIAFATTAHSSRSARNFGKMRPFETAPSSCPARPTRWRPRATDFGLSTWTTRSTAPMSIPSSRLEVATRHGMRPAFRSSSISTRCSRASEP